MGVQSRFVGKFGRERSGRWEWLTVAGVTGVVAVAGMTTKFEWGWLTVVGVVAVVGVTTKQVTLKEGEGP